MKKIEFDEMTLEQKLAWLDEMANNAKQRFIRDRNPQVIEIVNKMVSTGTRISVDLFEKYTGIKFSHDMTGKMEGILSLSSCCLLNPICRKRIASAVGICPECFASALVIARQNVCENTAFNYKQLSEIEIPAELIPYIDAEELRIESYGDVGTMIQAVNYIRMAVYNPHCAVTAWTKNPALYAAAFAYLGITECPSNFTVILSSPLLNVQCTISAKYAWFIKKTFTVYTLEWLLANNKSACFINCGGRKCKECERCYLNADRSEKHIREILKKDTKKAEKNGFTWYDMADVAPVIVSESDFSNLFI